jgi:hypothetical protein
VLPRDLLPKLGRLASDLVISEEGEWAEPVLSGISKVPEVSPGRRAPLWSNEELEAIGAFTAPLSTCSRAFGAQPT